MQWEFNGFLHTANRGPYHIELFNHEETKSWTFCIEWWFGVNTAWSDYPEDSFTLEQTKQQAEQTLINLIKDHADVSYNEVEWYDHCDSQSCLECPAYVIEVWKKDNKWSYCIIERWHYPLEDAVPMVEVSEDKEECKKVAFDKYIEILKELVE